MSGPTLLAVPITSADVPLDRQVRAAQAAGADLVELRVDCIGNLAAVEALLAGPRILPLIVTVRAATEGGSWSGDEAERIALLQRLGLQLPGYIDIEYAAWQRCANLRQKLELVCETDSPRSAPGVSRQRPKNRLILSYHDMQRTPPDLAAVFDKLAVTPGAMIKVVSSARDATDGLRVLEQLQRLAAGRDVIALAMGEGGLLTRVLARKYGAFLTFAALEAGRQSAAGQPTIAELRDLYRWEHIGPTTRVYGVVGWPVTHSLSPMVQNAALKAAGIDGVYLPLPVQPTAADFAAFMDALGHGAGLAFGGLSVTAPHKEHALRWLAARGLAVSAEARGCGAVNTLVRTPNGHWRGHNTDVLGAVEALRAVLLRSGPGAPRLPVALLGAGGVARAVVAALRRHGCAITVYNRTPGRAERLAQELGCSWQPWEQRLHYQGELLVNCTSVGMWPAVDESPLPDHALRPGTTVFDTIYQPPETRLLCAARARRCNVVSGVAMFIGQAAAQFRIWHGRTAPTETMRVALLEKLEPARPA